MHIDAKAMIVLLIIYTYTEALHIVKKCPRSEHLWKNRAHKLKCERGTLYHCVRVNNKKFAETCLQPTMLRTKDGCPWIDLADNHDEFKYNKSCTTQTGCPVQDDGLYRSNELYKYQACLGGRLSMATDGDSSKETSTFTHAEIDSSVSTSKNVNLMVSQQAGSTDLHRGKSDERNGFLSSFRKEFIGVVVFAITLISVIVAACLTCQPDTIEIFNSRRRIVSNKDFPKEKVPEENIYDYADIESIQRSLDRENDHMSEDALKPDANEVVIVKFDIDGQVLLQSHTSFTTSSITIDDSNEASVQYEEPMSHQYHHLDLLQASLENDLPEKNYETLHDGRLPKHEDQFQEKDADVIASVVFT